MHLPFAIHEYLLEQMLKVRSDMCRMTIQEAKKWLFLGENFMSVVTRVTTVGPDSGWFVGGIMCCSEFGRFLIAQILLYGFIIDIY